MSGTLKSITIAILSALICSACTRVKNESPDIPDNSKSAADCSAFQKKLPKDFIQGTVEVPEDYAQPNGPKTHVFYYGRIGQGENATIVFFNGGPAGDSHSSFTAINPIVAQTEQTKAYFPILYIDQRGTGCSDDYPGPAKTIADLHRLSHYGSKEIVQDAEVIRKKLQGNKKWKVFGQSFGGLIAKRYLQVAPEGIRSLHVHGFSSSNDENKWLAMRIKAQNRLTQDFFNTYPGDRERFNKAEALLTEQSCVTIEGHKNCGKQILYSMTMLLGFHTAWPYMHNALGDFVRNGMLNQSGLDAYGKDVLANHGDGSDPWPSLTINWVDQGATAFSKDTCTKIYALLSEQGEKPEEWPLHECKSAMASTTDMFSAIPSYLSPIPQNVITLNIEAELVRQHPEIPFFLYSGAQDGFVPTESFSEEVQVLASGVRYRDFPTSGHEGFVVETSVWTNLYYDLTTAPTSASSGTPVITPGLVQGITTGPALKFLSQFGIKNLVTN